MSARRPWAAAQDKRGWKFKSGAALGVDAIITRIRIAAGRHRSPGAIRRNASRRLIHWQTLQQHAEGRARPRDLRVVNAAAARHAQQYTTTLNITRREGAQQKKARRGARLLG